MKKEEEEHIQDFEVVVSGATRVKRLKLSKPSHTENLASKYERLNLFYTYLK